MSLEERALARALEVAADQLVEVAVGDAVLDGLSVAIAGSHHPRVQSLAETMCAVGDRGQRRRGDAAVWFSGRSASAAQAAMLNGMALHATDFDDTHDAAIVHCMSAILPAAVAGAELADGARSPDIAAAVSAGTELACNLALSRGKYAGWHYTTLCGTMGAALACSVAAGGTVERHRAAVGNAYVFAAGNKQSVLDSSLMKRLMPGFAAHNGVLAYQSAVSGLDGVENWLSGTYGLLALFFEGSADTDPLDGGSQARISELSYKPYPACRFTHGAIEAALRLHEGLGPNDITTDTQVKVHYPALDRFGIVCRPYSRRGSDEMDAQFSTAYLVASVLRHGRIDFSSYTPERLSDEGTARLASQVEVVCDLPPQHAASLGPIEVWLDGRCERVEHVLGSPERGLSSSDRRAKFTSCLTRYVEQAPATNHTRAEAIESPVWELLTESVETLPAAVGSDALLRLVRADLLALA